MAILENFRSQFNNKQPATFRSVAEAVCAHFELDQMLMTMIPRHFKTPLEGRTEGDLTCFRDAHARLLDVRETLLPWLLLKTYADHPPTAVEAYRFLKLGDIQKMLETFADLIKSGPQHLGRCKDHWETGSLVRNQNDQIQFLLEQLVQYGIQADNYAEAVQEYVALLDSVFPAAVRTNGPSCELRVTVSPVATAVAG